MNIDNSLSIDGVKINISGLERWEVYHRLRALDVPCQCKAYEPLEVDFQTPDHLLHLWSVIRELRSSRRVLVNWLESCAAY